MKHLSQNYWWRTSKTTKLFKTQLQPRVTFPFFCNTILLTNSYCVPRSSLNLPLPYCCLADTTHLVFVFPFLNVIVGTLNILLFIHLFISLTNFLFISLSDQVNFELWSCPPEDITTPPTEVSNIKSISSISQIVCKKERDFCISLYIRSSIRCIRCLLAW